jgi:hypothetical protein
MLHTFTYTNNMIRTRPKSLTRPTQASSQWDHWKTPLLPRLPFIIFTSHDERRLGLSEGGVSNGGFCYHGHHSSGNNQQKKTALETLTHDAFHGNS